MAKGQKRSNREARKPKQDKVPVATVDPFASLPRLAPAASPKAGSGKGSRS
jgi:hypothetical protein